jgi:hypothetical protein
MISHQAVKKMENKPESKLNALLNTSTWRKGVNSSPVGVTPFNLQEGCLAAIWT